MFLDKFIKCFTEKSKLAKNTDAFRKMNLQLNDYFVNNQNHKKKIENLMENYRNKFEIIKGSNTLCGSGGMSEHQLVVELINYFNNDICISAAIFNGINNYNDEYEFKVIAYYADNISVKIISAWDYLFQILNQYLGTNLLGDYRTRDRIVAFLMNPPEFIKDGDDVKVNYKNLPQDKVNEIYARTIKEKRVLQVDKKNRQLKKSLKNMDLSITPDIQKIFELYREDDLEVLKAQVRNDIIHKRSLTFNISINSAELFPMVGISSAINGWYNFNDLSVLIEKNLLILTKGIQILNEIIFYDKYPNSKENEGKEFVVRNFKCNSCNKEQYVVKDLVEELKKVGYKYTCINCGNEMVDTGEYKVNERSYYFTKFENIKDILETIKKFGENVSEADDSNLS